MKSGLLRYRRKANDWCDFTGGTIGSSISDGYISTDPEMRYMLLKMYKESCGYDDFVTDAPCTILSENINCSDFVIIAKAVHK